MTGDASEEGKWEALIGLPSGIEHASAVLDGLPEDAVYAAMARAIEKYGEVDFPARQMRAEWVSEPVVLRTVCFEWRDGAHRHYEQGAGDGDPWQSLRRMKGSTILLGGAALAAIACTAFAEVHVASNDYSTGVFLVCGTESSRGELDGKASTVCAGTKIPKVLRCFADSDTGNNCCRYQCPGVVDDVRPPTKN